MMIKEGLSYNLLEWASWEDQILTMIIFEERGRVDGEECIKGTIFMSIYRTQTEEKGKQTATRVIYEKIEENLTKIHERYENPKIILGGDYNDIKAPESL